jgi:hypothetical protein
LEHRGKTIDQSFGQNTILIVMIRVRMNFQGISTGHQPGQPYSAKRRPVQMGAIGAVITGAIDGLGHKPALALAGEGALQ